LVGARADGGPARDMRFAAPEMPFFSSPELASLPFSSAELLTDARDLCDGAVAEAVDPVLRAAEVAGRVGGLFSVLPLVFAAVVAGLAALEADGGRLAAVDPDAGRLAPVADSGLFLGDDSSAVSLVASGLDLAGLDLASSPPDRMVESTGVAGGSFSEATSVGGMGSSVEAMVVVIQSVSASRRVWCTAACAGRC